MSAIGSYHGEPPLPFLFPFVGKEGYKYLLGQGILKTKTQHQRKIGKRKSVNDRCWCVGLGVE